MRSEPYRIKYTIRSFSCKLTFLIFSTFGTFPEALFAEDVYFNTGRRAVSLDQMEGLSLSDSSERTALALAMISYYANSSDSNKRKALDRFGRMPDGSLWQSAAEVYFRPGSSVSRKARLEELSRQSQEGSPLRLLLRFENSVATRSFQMDELRFFGPAVQALGLAQEKLARTPANFSDLSDIVRQLELPLTDAGFIPFGDRLAPGLPDQLDRVGLPLEAAIVARAIQRGRPSIPDAENRISVYLAHAGDFAGAFRVETTTHPAVLRTRAGALRAMNWMILGKDYARSLEIHSKYLSGEKAFGMDDPWTGFPLTRGTLQVRSAGLLFLNGEKKQALEILESLAKTKQFEVESGTARLLQAQLVFEDNPELARQIAEDLTYRAQENSLYLLEYHATVLEGLALQRQGKDYYALINFVKARGIIHSHLKRPPTRALALGMLLTGLRLNPAGPWKPQFTELMTEEARTRDHSALQLLRDFLPAGHNSLAWKKALLESLAARKLQDDLLSVLASFLEMPILHASGESPGSISGFEDSLFWKSLATFEEKIQPAPPWKGGGEGLVRSAMEAALSKGGMIVMIPDGEKALVVSVQKDEAGIKFLGEFYSSSCLFGTNSPADCEKVRESVRRQVDVSSSVFFPAGMVPRMDLASEPARIDWRVASRIRVGPPETGREPTVLSQPVYACRHDDARNILPLSRMFDREGSWALPEFRKKNPGQPVYLGRLVCGSEELRLWDLDRFRGTTQINRTLIFSSSEIVNPLSRLSSRNSNPIIEYAPDQSDLRDMLMKGKMPGHGRYRILR